MSDPKQNAALTSRDVAHIVEAAGTHSLTSASVLSSRVITEATTHLQRSATALEQILATLQGQGTEGQGTGASGGKPMSITATLDPASAKSISDTMTTAIQPQIDKHGEMLGNFVAQLGEFGRAAAESERVITSVLLGEDGHIRQHDVAIAALVLRIEALEALCRNKDDPRPGTSEASGADYTQQTREMREAHDVLRDRIGELEGSVRRLMARGPEGGGTGSGGPGGTSGGPGRASRPRRNS